MGKKGEKLPRRIYYKFEIPNLDTRGKKKIGISSIGNDMKVYIKTDNGNIDLKPSIRKIVYSGVEKERIILQQPCVNQESLGNPVGEIFGYDLIVTIDTNYKIIDNEKYASTCWILCEKDKQNMSTYGLKVYCYDWIATEHENPECVMYANIIDSIEKQRISKNLNSKIAFVIDSDLDKIDDINKKIIPIYSDFFLPDSSNVFYANSQRGTTEYIENKLMQMCDKEAADSLKEYIDSITIRNE